MKLFGKQVICFLFVFCFIFETTSAKIKEEDIELRSEYVIMMRLDDGLILYEKNVHEKMYPASMTKMMTTLVALDTMDHLQTTCTITNEMLEGLAAANASVAGFVAGEVVTYEDLLYAILLPSGADATNAVAMSLFGSQEALVEAMNAKAKSLGMKATHFANGSGLHDDNHYSSAYDMSILLKYALKNETFKSIISTPTYLTSSGRLTLHSTLFKEMKNTHFTIQESQGNTNDVRSQILGGKTGYTLEASLCLASYAQNEEEGFIMISGQTHSDNQTPYHVMDAYSLYDYVFQRYQKQDIFHEGDEIGAFEVKYANKDSYVVKAQKEYRVMLDNEGEKQRVFFRPVKNLQAPMAVNTKIGTLIIEEEGEVVLQEDLLLDKKVEQNRFAYYVRHFDECLYDFRYVIGGVVVLISGVFIFIRRNQTKRLRG